MAGNDKAHWVMSDAAKTIKAAADGLGMARWSGVGGGCLPEVDVVNRMDIRQVHQFRIRTRL